MNEHERPLLDDDERGLAERLARVPAGSGPAAALDARILAAARTAVAGDATTPPVAPYAAAPTSLPQLSSHTGSGRRRRRHFFAPGWPAAMGVAASILLASGIAWRIQSLPGDVPATAPVQAADDAEQALAMAPPPAPPAAATVPPPPAVAEPAPVSPPAPQKPAVRDVAQRDVAQAPVGGAATVLSSDVALPQARSAPVAAPPPAPMAAAPAPVQAEVREETATLLRQEPAQPAASAGAPATAAAALPRAAASADNAAVSAKEHATAQAKQAGYNSADVNADPPATTDSSALQTAWLKRIRELQAKGDTQAAKDSLAEFRRRHPKATIPNDLQPLLATP